MDVFLPSICVGSRPSRWQNTHTVQSCFVHICHSCYSRKHWHNWHFLPSASITLGWIFDQNRSLVITRSEHIVERASTTVSVTVIEPIVIVAVRRQRLATLRVELIDWVLMPWTVGNLLLLNACSGLWPTNANTHLGLHVIHVLLGVLDHLHRLVPLFLERGLSLFNLLLFDMDPPFNLLFLMLVGSWWELVLIELLLYYFLLPTLPEF